MPTPIIVIAWIAGIAVIVYYVVMIISSRVHSCCVCEGRGFKERRKCAKFYRQDAKDKDENVRLESLARQQQIAKSKEAVAKRVAHGRVGDDIESQPISKS